MSSHFAAAFFLAKIAIRYIGGDKEKFLQRKERKKNNEKNQRLTESSTDGKPRSNLFARRSEGNWTHTWESETPSASGASEHKLAASWSVRGHYRHYASGKTVYVKPYTKGSGKKAAKAYKLASNV